jgi:hypothetical protein
LLLKENAQNTTAATFGWRITTEEENGDCAKKIASLFCGSWCLCMHPYPNGLLLLIPLLLFFFFFSHTSLSLAHKQDSFSTHETIGHWPADKQEKRQTFLLSLKPLTLPLSAAGPRH